MFNPSEWGVGRSVFPPDHTDGLSLEDTLHTAGSLVSTPSGVFLAYLSDSNVNTETGTSGAAY